MGEKLAVIILAAGKGKRMGGERAKVLVDSFSGPLLHSVLESALSLAPEQIVVVVGFDRENVERSAQDFLKEKRPDFLKKIIFAVQTEQRGTGDAAKAALPALSRFNGNVLFLCGDAPLITNNSLAELIQIHQEKKATISVLTASLSEPGSLGRIVRDETGALIAIREVKDASPKELLIREVNSGVYVVDSSFLPGALSQLDSSNAQGEFYLTDIVGLATKEGQTVASLVSSRGEEIAGVNTPQDLHFINAVQQDRIRLLLAQSGVRFLQPHTTVVYPDTRIEKDASGTKSILIGPSTLIGPGVTLGAGVTLEGSSYITNSTIGAHSTIKWGSRIDGSTIGEGCSIGPFANIRPESHLERDVKVGNFVEIKKSLLEEGAKASHLTYLGDAKIGKEANIGAGTITCNYDGYRKFKTEIGAGAFIGSNTALVAPVKVGEGATVGAGSTISKDVAPDALALTRAEQRAIPGWSKKKRESKAKS